MCGLCICTYVWKCAYMEDDLHICTTSTNARHRWPPYLCAYIKAMHIRKPYSVYNCFHIYVHIKRLCIYESHIPYIHTSIHMCIYKSHTYKEVILCICGNFVYTHTHIHIWKHAYMEDSFRIYSIWLMYICIFYNIDMELCIYEILLSYMWNFYICT